MNKNDDENSIRDREAFFERMRAGMQRIADENATPAGIARLAAFKAADERRAWEERDARMTAIGIPALSDLRIVAVDAQPPRTLAIRAVQWALQWRGETPRYGGRQPLVLVLSGHPGCGKSCAAAWACVHSRGTQFVAASRVASTADNGYSTNTAMWEEWRSADLLALDELGDELNKADVSERITTLLSDRYNNGRATIVTTNLALPVFVERYMNDRLTSRLVQAQAKGANTPRDARERGGCPWWLDLPAVDYRVADNRAALEGGER